MSSTGLMNRMRDKTHIILIILVLAFLATIVFEWGMNYLGLRGGQTVEFGSVNGQEITYTEFESQMQMDSYRLSNCSPENTLGLQCGGSTAKLIFPLSKHQR